MTVEWLNAQLGMLLVLKSPPADTAGYYEALRDIPEEVLRRAVGHALRTRAWFPTPAEVRLDCDVVAGSDRARAAAEDLDVLPDPHPTDSIAYIANPFSGESIAVRVVREWRHSCDDCGDTGRVSLWCGPGGGRFPWMGSRPCGRRFEHGGHDWVEECPCVEHNQTIQRRKDAQRRYAQEPGKVA